MLAQTFMKHNRANAGWHRSLLAGVTIVALVPASVQAHANRVVEGPKPPAAGEADTVDGALAEGDLTTARELTAPTEAENPNRTRDRAKVCEQAADYACAIAAWKHILEDLPQNSPERSEIEATIVDLEDMSRGTVEDEPASTHREEYDHQRAAKLAALAPKPPPVVADTPPPPEPIKIHRKWYFWVTLGAIVASAAAITGIAIKAATSAPEDDLDTEMTAARLPLQRQGLGFRF